MAATRPNMLDLRSNTNNTTSSSGSRPLRSPRLHVAGEAPPELSPLDAFALQSRLLAKQLQENDKDGNRLSRLPPLTTESPLILQGRSDYFRSMSMESGSDNGDLPDLDTMGLGLKTELEDPFDHGDRPMSMHPRMSRIPPTPDESVPSVPRPLRDLSRGRKLNQIGERGGYFGARQERSPSPIYSETQSQPDRMPERSPGRKDNSLPISSSIRKASVGSVDRNRGLSFDDQLAPPRGFGSHRLSSNLSSPRADEDMYNSMAASTHSLPPRKLSSGSAVLANIGHSPAVGSFHRSPSVASDISILPKPSFNFSRPLSRAGTPSLDTPSRQASSDSHPSFVLADESAHTPVSMNSEGFMDQPIEDPKNAAPSYIYSKFTLPRGKSIQRLNALDRPVSPQLQVSEPQSSNMQHHHGGAPPSPPSRPSSSAARAVPDDAVSLMSSVAGPRPSVDASKISMESPRLAKTPSIEVPRQSEEQSRGRSLEPVMLQERGRTPASVSTDDTGNTIRPTTRSGGPAASEMSAEEHLSKGIACHENGSLNESTYHLRYAAKQGHPTAMLLYALACRHGWGMRANQKEGVEWLRKAAECASIEIAEEEEQAKGGKHVDVVERRTRKAQFALSIYELGVSHMNGWGIEQDKALALRCFEIAGTWGDVDALAEAGFCYAQGVGCTKNLKKSAKFYRMAEAKGMSMVGNSWIHKAKYNDTGDDGKKTSPKKDAKKSRSKSRTRTMFGLKSLS
ncbi:Protein DSF2 [Paramyrothecium foliicola]|nr:Protein DSF2 [Paramyrothecium foliicola]